MKKIASNCTFGNYERFKNKTMIFDIYCQSKISCHIEKDPFRIAASGPLLMQGAAVPFTGQRFRKKIIRAQNLLDVVSVYK